MVKRYIFLAGPTLKIPSEQEARIAPKTQGSLYFALLQTQLNEGQHWCNLYGRSKRESRVFFM